MSGSIEPMRTTGKRYIEMSTAEWIGRLVMSIPEKYTKGYGEILKLREEKEINSAVEWLENRHSIIKDKVLKITLPKDKKEWDEKDAEFIKNIVDITSARWLEEIKEAFKDTMEEK